ncbi:MAG: hypothetical protein PHT07_24405 [Paludibacter sp.]|nr:hypothetical protein [Paludibacter sp.]
MNTKRFDRVFIVGEGNDFSLDIYPASSFPNGIEMADSPITSKGYDRRDTKKAVWATVGDRKPRLVVAHNVKINDDLVIPRELLGELPPAAPLDVIRGEIV